MKDTAPLIRVAKRNVIDKKVAYLIRFSSIIFALIVGMIPIIVAGKNPFTSYAIIVEGALGKPGYIRQMIKIAIPLLGCALAITPCFKMRFWNIGAEGQITMGAIFSSFFAINLTSNMPTFFMLLIMCLAGAIGGAIWAFIPGFFKAKFGTNETLFTLMMNYIAIGIARWLQGGPWEGRPGTQLIPMFSNNARLPSVFGIYCGWIIVLLIVGIMHVYMNYTKHGYEVAVIGDSYNTARYAGMNVGWVMMRTMLLSGAISGLVGWMLVSGANGTLNSDVAGGVGFTAITVAWLSQLNCFVMIVISLMLAIISKGSATLQTRLNVPSAVAEIVSGVLLFSMLACEFFINYRVVIRPKTLEKLKSVFSFSKFIRTKNANGEKGEKDSKTEENV